MLRGELDLFIVLILAKQLPVFTRFSGILSAVQSKRENVWEMLQTGEIYNKKTISYSTG